MPSPPNLARELWIEIFTYSVMDHECILRIARSIWPGYSSVWGTTTLRISHVCRIWRDIITALPDLWSSFHIDSFNLHIIPLLELYLQRSAGRLLSVRIDVRFIKDRSGLVKVLSLLMQHRGRFRHLRFATDQDTNFPWVDIYPSERPLFPLLESLIFSNGRASVPSWFLEGIRSAPKLENVELTVRNLLTINNTRDMLADSQIKVLTIQNINTFQNQFHDFRELLSTLQKIETIKIYGYSTDFDHRQTLSRPVRNQNLRTLIFTNTKDPGNLLSSLELPALETLMLSHWGLTAKMLPYQASNLFLTLQRFPSLHRLSFDLYLDETQPSSTWLIELVQRLPNLTTLDVSIGGGGGCILNLLFALASNPTLGRRLTRLYLSDVRNSILDMELAHRIIGALEMRVTMSKENEVARLTDVRMFEYRWRGDLPEETQSEYQHLNRRLEQLKVEGMTCAIQIGLRVFLGKSGRRSDLVW